MVFVFVAVMESTFTDEQKRQLAGKAQTIFERLEGPATRPTPDLSDELVDDLIEDWRKAIGGDQEFHRRLDLDNLSEAECRMAIQCSQFPDSSPLPGWVKTLEVICIFLREKSPSDYKRDDTDSLPFVEFFAAVADHARDRLSDTAVPKLLSDTALESMERWLLERLVSAFTRILYVEFKTFIALCDPTLAFADPSEMDSPSTEYYEQFIGQLFNGRFKELCVDYPMFGRLLSTRVDQWVEFIQEFCHRLESDQVTLADQFHNGCELGTITDLAALANDTHGGGKAVLRVTFESGVEIVYKPRDVNAGVALHDVLERLEPHLAVPPFRYPIFCPEDGYGWMEWLESRDCPTTDAVERYYHRAGAMLCVTYLLGFIDCHQENLIAHGEYPIIVDCEPALHPPASLAKRPFDELSFTFVEQSVLRVGLLPWTAEKDGIDKGKRKPENKVGFGAEALEKPLSEYKVPKVRSPNTDVMSVEFITPTVDLRANTPTLEGETQSPGTYVEPLVEGFRITYRTIQDLYEKSRLLSEIEFLDAFEGIENRFLFRGTQVYLSLVSSIRKTALESGPRFTIEVEQLVAPFFEDIIQDEALWPLYAAEREALKRLDPPRITSRTNGTELRFDGTKLGASVEQSGMEAAKERLDKMSEEDLQRQLQIIERCFNAKSTTVSAWGSNTEKHPQPVDLSIERLQRESAALMKRVKNAGLKMENGELGWISLLPQPNVETLFINCVEESLYSGRSGIAIASSALYHCTGDESYRTFAMETIAPVRQALDNQRDIADGNIGGASGISSVAYSLGVLGDLLDKSSLFADAKQAASLITDERVAQDGMFGVIDGSAGAILGLLGLYDRCGDYDILSIAVQCGDHLLAKRVEGPNSSCVWNTGPGPRPLTGFSHGVAGIAYSLCRLGHTADVPRFVEAAREGLRYESHVFSEAQQNWPDYRPDTSETFVDRWCHGRSGIGLSRAGILRYEDDPLMESVLEQVIEEVRRNDLLVHDHLCCGNSSRVELLLEGVRTFGSDNSAARKYVARMLAKADATGGLVARCDSKYLTNPTFFLGLSGIAYTMLRVVSPDELPCLLLWE